MTAGKGEGGQPAVVEGSTSALAAMQTGAGESSASKACSIGKLAESLHLGEDLQRPSLSRIKLLSFKPRSHPRLDGAQANNHQNHDLRLDGLAIVHQWVRDVVGDGEDGDGQQVRQRGVAVPAPPVARANQQQQGEAAAEEDVGQLEGLLLYVDRVERLQKPVQ
jgi:hypothetical protein